MKQLSSLKPLVFGIFACILASSAQATSSVNYHVPFECNPKADQLIQLLQTYNAEASKSNVKKSDAAYAKIDQLLFHDLDPSSACWQPMLNFYIAQCYQLYDSDNVTVYTNKRYGHQMVMGRLSGIPRVLEVLLNHNKFTYLTPEKRLELGGAWTEKLANSNDYTSLGAYDCAESQIYIDPYLRPFDMITTVYHEIDHLLRDKSQPSPPEKLLKAGSTPEKPIVDWKLFNLSEEAEAIAISATPFLAAISQDPWALDISSRFSFLGREAKVYNILNDFTLFSKDGPVREYQKLHRDQFPEVNSILLFGWKSPEVSINDPEKESSIRNKFFNAIATTYFPNQKIELPGSESYADFFDFAEKTFFSLGWDEAIKKDPANLWQYIRDLEQVIKTNTPSNSCKLYMNAMAASEVDGYLGVHFSKINGHKDAMRPCMNLKRQL